mmetsp:Transcript_24057/g.55833  ORF Transcript_24057/g.55833 Transcript_24057/m.55833 type:complete len:202 (-) Transcript_24057:153-758(-)
MIREGWGSSEDIIHRRPARTGPQHVVEAVRRGFRAVGSNGQVPDMRVVNDVDLLKQRGEDVGPTFVYRIIQTGPPRHRAAERHNRGSPARPHALHGAAGVRVRSVEFRFAGGLPADVCSVTGEQNAAAYHAGGRTKHREFCSGHLEDGKAHERDALHRHAGDAHERTRRGTKEPADHITTDATPNSCRYLEALTRKPRRTS